MFGILGAVGTIRHRGIAFRVYPKDLEESATRHVDARLDAGEAPVIAETLNRHRTSAATYRQARNWCAIWITDVLDVFRDTLSDLALVPPPIDPFERVLIVNATGRMVARERHGGNVIVADVPY